MIGLVSAKNEIEKKPDFSKAISFTPLIRPIFNRGWKVIQDRISFALLRSVIVSEICTTFSLIRSKTKTYCDFVTHIFPRFGQFALIYFAFPLAP